KEPWGILAVLAYESFGLVQTVCIPSVFHSYAKSTDRFACHNDCSWIVARVFAALSALGRLSWRGAYDLEVVSKEASVKIPVVATSALEAANDGVFGCVDL